MSGGTSLDSLPKPEDKKKEDTNSIDILGNIGKIFDGTEGDTRAPTLVQDGGVIAPPAPTLAEAQATPAIPAANLPNSAMETALPGITAPAVQQTPNMGIGMPGLTPVMGSTTQTSTSQQELTPEAKKAVAEEKTARETAIKAGQKIGTMQAAADLAHAQEVQKVADAQKLDMWVNEEARQNITAHDQQAQKDAEKAYSNMHLDPNRAFGHSTAASITAAIAVGLGAYSSAIVGGPNHALNIVNAAIDRDIDAQKTEMAKAKDKVEMVRNRFHDNLKRFGDERQAEAMTRLQSLKAVDAMYDVAVAKIGADKVGAQALEQKANLAKEIANEQLKISEITGKKVANTTTTETSMKMLGLSPIDQIKRHDEAASKWTEEAKPYVERRNSLDELQNIVKGAKDNPALAAEAFLKNVREASGNRINETEIHKMTLDPGIKNKIISAIKTGVMGKGLTDSEWNNLSEALRIRRQTEDSAFARVANNRREVLRNTQINPDVVMGADAMKAASYWDTMNQKKAAQDKTKSSLKAASASDFK